ncbi:MAG: hypothetical protein ACTTKC_09005 [Treponema sp.]|uniref:hypothetical protein n=1 Tax=Treponema sp. TaxID=166 RepID=UPI003FA2BBDC
MIKKQLIWSCCVFLCGIHAAFAIVLPDGTDAVIRSVKKYPSGKIESAELSEPTEFNTPIGKLTFSGTVTFYESGGIRTVGDADYNDGDGATIETPVGEFEVTALSFYESGKLESFYSRRYSYQTVHTSIGEFKVAGWVRLYESGKLYECIINNNYYDDPYTIKKGQYTGVPISDEISFYENGSIKSFNPKGQITTSIGKIKPDGTVEFYEDGNLRSAKIEAQVFDTPFGLLSLSFLEVFPSGKLKRISFSDSVSLPENYLVYAEINKKGVGVGRYSKPLKISEIELYENGAVKWCGLENAYFINNPDPERDGYATDRIWFYKSGKQMGFGLYEYDYDAGEYRYRNLRCFSEDGTFLGAAVLDEASDTLKKAAEEKDK